MSEFEIMDRHFVELEPYSSLPVGGFAGETDHSALPNNNYIIIIDGDILTLKAL